VELLPCTSSCRRGIAVFVPAVLTAAGIKGVLLRRAAVGAFVVHGAWCGKRLHVLGIIYLGYLYAKAPSDGHQWGSRPTSTSRPGPSVTESPVTKRTCR